jgi:hypothetical protein
MLTSQAWRDRAEKAEARVAELEAEIVAMMRLVPAEHRIQCCEGGGPESPVGSLALSIGRLAGAVSKEALTASAALTEAERECYMRARKVPDMVPPFPFDEIVVMQELCDILDRLAPPAPAKEMP